MVTKLEIVRNKILTPIGLTELDLERILGLALEKGADCADVYLQIMHSESWVLEDGIVKKGCFGIDQGVGIRAISGDKTGFAYTQDLAIQSLADAAKTAGCIARAGQNRRVEILSYKPGHDLYPPVNPIESLAVTEKIALLEAINVEAHSIDPRVHQVIARLSGSYETVLMLDSEGGLTADIRPLVRLNVSILVESNGKRESGTAGCGGRNDFSVVLPRERALVCAREAVRLALLNLEAIPAPAGLMSVVLGSGWPAVMIHEAVGHGIEGDFNRKGTSIFTGKIGQPVASHLCNIVDHGNLCGDCCGSLNVDDEGTLTQYNVLIENGKLSGYLYDKFNAKLMGVKSTGNGRRASYADIPIPRMTNTYMLPGKSDPEEIIASVGKGIYAVNFTGGQVDITSGDFVFSTSEAYLIENGKIGAPIKNATLIGNGPEVLNRITMVGNDLKLDDGIGRCGKDGQSVAVGVGQPTLKISELTVGGTSAIIEN